MHAAKTSLYHQDIHRQHCLNFTSTLASTTFYLVVKMPSFCTRRSSSWCFFIKTLFSKRCCIPLPAQDEVKSNPLELWPFHQGHRITY